MISNKNQIVFSKSQAEELETFRLAKSFTSRSSFARYIGVEDSYYNYIINSKVPMTSQVLIKLKKKFPAEKFEYIAEEFASKTLVVKLTKEENTKELFAIREILKAIKKTNDFKSDLEFYQYLDISSSIYYDFISSKTKSSKNMIIKLHIVLPLANIKSIITAVKDFVEDNSRFQNKLELSYNIQKLVISLL